MKLFIMRFFLILLLHYAFYIYIPSPSYCYPRHAFFPYVEYPYQPISETVVSYVYIPRSLGRITAYSGRLYTTVYLTTKIKQTDASVLFYCACTISLPVFILLHHNKVESK
jgi:hypothetical protein